MFKDSIFQIQIRDGFDQALLSTEGVYSQITRGQLSQQLSSSLGFFLFAVQQLKDVQ